MFYKIIEDDTTLQVPYAGEMNFITINKIGVYLTLRFIIAKPRILGSIYMNRSISEEWVGPEP